MINFKRTYIEKDWMDVIECDTQVWHQLGVQA